VNSLSLTLKRLSASLDAEKTALSPEILNSRDGAISLYSFLSDSELLKAPAFSEHREISVAVAPAPAGFSYASAFPNTAGFS
jgi:hypothetical protein